MKGSTLQIRLFAPSVSPAPDQQVVQGTPRAATACMGPVDLSKILGKSAVWFKFGCLVLKVAQVVCGLGETGFHGVTKMGQAMCTRLNQLQCFCPPAPV